MLLPLTTALCGGEDCSYNSCFSSSELRDVLQSLKNTAHGKDQIHNAMLKNLPAAYQNWMLRIINSSFINTIVPKVWKHAIILPIHKPGKPVSSVASYRPISLLSCFVKVLEKLVANRLNYILENNNAYNRTQGGFRKRLSTIAQIARFEMTVIKTIVNRKICISVFFM